MGEPVEAMGEFASVKLPSPPQRLIVRASALAPLDVDSDGLNSLEEAILGTNPRLPDSDRDRVSDGVEFAIGSDPLDASSNGRYLQPSSFNRRINQEAHEQMGRMLDEGIAVFAFHPDGGWVIVTEKGNKFARSIPTECNQKLEEFLARGHHIRSIAFPPGGGNRWVIVTDQTLAARNIPNEAYQKLLDFQNDDREIRCVAFPYERFTDNSWVIVADDDFSARNIDDEAYQVMRNLFQYPRPGRAKSRPIHFIAFEPGGGWTILAEDYYFARNIDDGCFQQMGNYYNQLRENAIVAFDPDGDGWSVIANDKLPARLLKDPIETFESSVGGKSIWPRMRDANVPGVSVAVVIDNELTWSAGYGHLADGADAATHPESMFQAASISKVVTAIGMHKLIDEGEINLTDDIRDDLNVTIPARGCLSGDPDMVLRDVLRHRSSVMGRGTTFPLTNCGVFLSGGGGYEGYAASENLPTLNQIIAGSGPTNSSPITRSRSGGTFSYSGDGYTLLQKLVQDLTDESFSFWMRNEILVPTGMNDSYFQISLPPSYFDDRQVAAGHDFNGDRISGDRRRYPEFAAAGLYSNAEDLARMIIMLNNNGKVGKKTVLSQTGRDNLVLNGIGVFRSNGNISATNNLYTHGGTNSGFRSIFIGFPAIDAGIVVMTNGDSNVGMGNFREEVAQAVIDAYGW